MVKHALFGVKKNRTWRQIFSTGWLMSLMLTSPDYNNTSLNQVNYFIEGSEKYLSTSDVGT
jgi:hypothetical protein